MLTLAINRQVRISYSAAISKATKYFTYGTVQLYCKLTRNEKNRREVVEKIGVP